VGNLKIIKTFILSVLLILFAALFWKGLADIYLHGNLLVSSFIWFSASLILFVVFFLFLSLLVEKKLIVFVIYLFSLSTFFIFFSAPKADQPGAGQYYYFISAGLAVLFIAFILSRTLIQKERNERLKISMHSVFKVGLPWIMTMLALFIGLVGYFHPLTPTDKNEINLPPQILDWLVKPLAGTLSKTLPMLSEKTTIDEALALSTATKNLDLISLSPSLLAQLKGKNIKDLSPAQLMKDPVIAKILQEEAAKQVKKIDPQVLAQQRNDLAKTLGISLAGKETMSEVINKIINAKIRDLVGPAIGVLPFISAILIFVVLRLIFIPLGWLIILLALLIFQLLRIFKFVKIEKVMKEGEDVRI